MLYILIIILMIGCKKEDTEITVEETKLTAEETELTKKET